MDIQNHYYGHSAVFARYLGLSSDMHIPGLIQHGWTSDSPLRAHFGDFNEKYMVKRDRKYFIWSQETRLFRFESIPESVIAIGSPWLYLTKEHSQFKLTTSQPVFFPTHGTKVIRHKSNSKKNAEQLLSEFGTVTVCIHGDDVADDRYLAGWLESGHRVVSAGSRRDPLFLWRLRSILSSATVHISDRVATSMFYAASIGVPCRILEMNTSLSVDSLGPSVLEKFPEFRTESDSQQEIAYRELGFNFVRTEVELTDLFFTNESRGLMIDCWLRSPVHKSATIINRGNLDNGELLEPSSITALLRNPMSHFAKRLSSKLPELDAFIAPIEIKSLP